ncbi:MAG: extracellular solute-binding protein [Lentisphaeria bacterium]
MVKLFFYNKTKSILSIAVVFIVLIVCTANAGWIEDKDGKIIIHVKAWNLPDIKSSAINEIADCAVVKSFVTKFPALFKKRYAAKYKANPQKYGNYNWDDVEIKMHPFSGISIEGMGQDSKPLMAIAGGVAPDILYVNFRMSDTYIQGGFLYPLDKPEDGYFSSMEKEELDFCVHEKIWPVIKRKGPNGKVHVWAKPQGGILGKVVFYRKDLLDEFGIDYPSNDWTWNDLMEMCKKITDPQKGTYGISIGKGMDESWYWLSFLWSAGGSVMFHDKQKDEWRASFDSDAAVTALDFYTRLCNEPWQDSDGRDHFGYAARESVDRDKWERGKIGFNFSYINEKLFSSISPDVTGMVAVPLGPGGKRGGELNSRMQGLYAKIKDIPVRDAAWEYMRYTDSKEAVEIRTKKMVEGGLGRFVNPKYLRMFGYDDIIRMAPKGWEKTFDISMNSGEPEPYGKNCQTVYYYMTYPIQDAAAMQMAGEFSEEEQEKKAQLKHLLVDAVNLTNAKMLKHVSPKEMRLRRIVASLLLLLIAVTFSFALSVIIKTFAPPKTEGVKSVKWGFFKYKTAYFILLPAILSIFFWQYLPLIVGSKMAFQDYQILKSSVWVGVDNFANILWEVQWWMAVWNSFCYSFLVVSLTFIPPVILAVLLDEVPYGKIFFRTLFYLPAVITGLVVIYLWKSFYGKEHTDVLNSIVLSIPAIGYILLGIGLFVLFALFARRLWMQQVRVVSIICVLVGVVLFVFLYTFAHNIMIKADAPWYVALFMKNINPYDWLGSRKTALLSCVIPMVWAGMGPGCLIYLAALKGIAPDFYEAADIDGATFLDKILFIVIPSLKALLIINFIGVFVASWKSSAYILAMTGIDPKTEVVGLKIFEDAYMFLQFGPAAAEAWMLGFMLIGFTIYQLRILSRLEFKTTGGDKK